MYGNSLRLLAFGLTLSLLFPACTTDFVVYAPEKEIRSVYCVLNAQDSVQYVRIARAFQVEGDALVYAGTNDLSLKDMYVKLAGGGKTWFAEAVDNYPKDSTGDFLPTHTVYKFITDGSGTGREALVPGETYALEVSTPDAPDFVRGTTTVPGTPEMRGSMLITSGAGTTKCLPIADWERDFYIQWDPVDARAYEVRIELDYTENLAPKTAYWGPTAPFEKGQGCSISGYICYKWDQRELISHFRKYMPDPDVNLYGYDRQDSCVTDISLSYLFPTSLRFEVTAVDTFLYNYMTINDPGVQDLTGARPEYTNLEGNIQVVGVLGSINTNEKNAILSDCVLRLLGMNYYVETPDCHW